MVCVGEKREREREDSDSDIESERVSEWASA